MRQPLQAQFVLNLQGQPSNDLYTVCGKCAGSVGDPSARTWRCGDVVNVGADGRAVTVFNLYKHCSFEWKWRNFNKNEHGGYEPPNNGDDNDRVFEAGDSVCSEGKIKTVFSKWGGMATDLDTRKNNGNCSSMIIHSPTTIYSTPSTGSRSAIAITPNVTEHYQGETRIVYVHCV